MRIFLSILFVLALAACSGLGNEGGTTSPSEQQPETPPTEKPNDEEGTESADVTEEPTMEDIMADIRDALDADFEVKLPATIAISTGKQLSTKILSDANHYNVAFFETEETLELNDPKLDRQEPFMIIKGKAFEMSEEANEQIGYQPIQEGMPEVDLGSGITGFQDAGAGSSFITWHEGRWSFIMRSRNDEAGNAAGLRLAKAVVDKLEAQALPVPHENGAGTFSSGDDVSTDTNRLAWQEENVVYEVFMADPLALLDVVTGDWK